MNEFGVGDHDMRENTLCHYILIWGDANPIHNSNEGSKKKNNNTLTLFSLIKQSKGVYSLTIISDSLIDRMPGLGFQGRG